MKRIPSIDRLENRTNRFLWLTKRKLELAINDFLSCGDGTETDYFLIPLIRSTVRDTLHDLEEAMNYLKWYYPVWMFDIVVEGISRADVLRKYDLVNTHQYVKHKHNNLPCLYFLCDSGRVVYIGQTEHLKARLKCHTKDKNKVFDSVYLTEVEDEQLRRNMERTLIQFITTKYNTECEIDPVSDPRRQAFIMNGKFNWSWDD